MAGTLRTPTAKPMQRKRFAVGARVRITSPGVTGTVIQADDEPTVLAEYWHTIECLHDGEPYTRREPGSILELVPEPVTNPSRQAPRFGNTTIHQYGPASRAYVGSEDRSVNFAAPDLGDVFRELRERITALNTAAPGRDDILARLDALEAAQCSPTWVERYKDLLSFASNHITVYGWLLAPLLQRLIDSNAH